MFLCDHGARVIRVVDMHAYGAAPWRLSGLGQGQGVHPVGPRPDRACRHSVAGQVLPRRQQVGGPDGLPMSDCCERADVLVESFAPSSRYQAIVHLRLAVRAQSAPGPLLHHRLWQAWSPQGRAAHRRPGAWPVWVFWQASRVFARRQSMWCIPCPASGRRCSLRRASAPRCWPEKRRDWAVRWRPP